MRLSIALLTTVITLFGSSSASACCLTDWLCGRTPYVAGFAPVVSPHTVNYPVATTTSVLGPSWSGTAPVLNSGAYQAQRPAYFDNPSVYSGMPVAGTVQVPVASNYRGNAAESISYLGASNRYPDLYNTGTYASAYGAAQAPVAAPTVGAPGLPLSVTNQTGAPSNALPATSVAPLFPPTAPRPTGLSRFFGSLVDTNYRSSYYRAPITYYRPATTVDPISGTTVTVQQPCTSYVQQLQRMPYSSLQAPGSTYAPPTPGCAPPMSPTPYGMSAPSGVGQASATMTSPTPGQFTVPIPSTTQTPDNSYYGQNGSAPSLSPLTGPPSGSFAPSTNPTPYTAPNPYTGSQPGGDLAPVDQPELRNRQPINQNGYDRQGSEPQPETEKPKSYWELQDADDSTAMIRNSQSQPNPWTAIPADPIDAPEDYVSPFRRQLESSTMPVNRKTFEAPPLPPRSGDSVELSSEQNWVSAPVREASMSRRQSYRPAPMPIQRDTTWKPARPR